MNSASHCLWCHQLRRGLKTYFRGGGNDSHQGRSRDRECRRSSSPFSDPTPSPNPFHKAVRHARAVNKAIRHAGALSPEELYSYAKDIGAPYELLKETAKLGRLPVVGFVAGGVATPADVAMMMQLGCDGGEPKSMFFRI